MLVFRASALHVTFQALSMSFTAIHSLYSNFIGAPHFRSMTRLLGYQGIAVVIEELLKIGKNLVSFTLFSLTELDICCAVSN